MTILVDDTLQDLYLELKNKGYQVHMMSEGIGGEVAVYSGRNTGLASLQCIYGMGGVFLIDGDNMPPAEIERMINDRSYSPLF